MIGVAVAAVIAGVVIAIVTAGASSPAPVNARSTRPGGRGEIALAARYLGLTRKQLRKDMRAGKTLADVADATDGRSKAGLIDALASARRSRIAAELHAGKLSQADESKKLAKLARTVRAEVYRSRLRH
jgi:hypothetical protein